MQTETPSPSLACLLQGAHGLAGRKRYKSHSRRESEELRQRCRYRRNGQSVALGLAKHLSLMLRGMKSDHQLVQGVTFTQIFNEELLCRRVSRGLG